MPQNDSTPTSPPETPPAPPAQPVQAGQPVLVYPPPPWWVQPPKKRLAGRLLRGVFVLLFILSVVVNIELAAILAVSAAGGMDTTVLQPGSDDEIVAVYPLTGMIDQKAVSRFEQFFRTVRDNKDIRAVVLRVDSGGGTVGASDEIYTMVRSIREDLRRPVVVSMGSVAASGGYYVSVAADAIYAEPTTITGSVGVIAVWPVLAGLFEKHGVEIITIRSPQARQWKAKQNLWEVPDPAVRKEVEEMLSKMHQKFESVVKAHRKEIQVGADHSPFNGKVFLAEEAHSLKLIDEIGYLDAAAKGAAELAGLDNPKRVQYSPGRSFIERFGFAGGGPPLDVQAFDKLVSPRILMVWRPE